MAKIKIETSSYKKIMKANMDLLKEKEDLERRFEIQVKENIKLRRELNTANEKLREKS